MKKILIFIILFGFIACSPKGYADSAPRIDADAALLIDLNSGQILYERNADKERAPASLTKIMTIILVLESIEKGEHDFEEIIVCDNNCNFGLDYDSSNIALVEGETISINNLLLGAAVASGNDACNALAICISGDIPSFVEKMNQKAKELGCTSTNFVDPNGLSDNNVTTARDLFLITNYAIRNPQFMQLCNTVSFSIPATTANEERTYYNSNALISSKSIYGSKYIYEPASGVKTGHTNKAGYCLVSTAQNEYMNLLLVILGDKLTGTSDSPDYGHFMDSIELYEWAFNNFNYEKIISKDIPIGEIKSVLHANLKEPVSLYPEKDIFILLNKDSKSDYSIEVRIDTNIAAPLEPGAIVGSAEVMYGGNCIAEVGLINKEEIKQNFFVVVGERIRAQKGISPFVIAVSGICLFIGILLVYLRISYKKYIYQIRKKRHK